MSLENCIAYFNQCFSSGNNSDLQNTAQSPQNLGEYKNSWDVTCLKISSLVSGGVLGGLGGLHGVGIAITPLAWTIAGSGLSIVLIGSAYCGGFKQFSNSIKFATVGAIVGLAAGVIAGGLSLKKTLCQAPKPRDPNLVTTLAVGEEGQDCGGSFIGRIFS